MGTVLDISRTVPDILIAVDMFIVMLFLLLYNKTMEIKNWLKNKYWLWGILLGIVLALIIAFIYSAFYVLVHPSTFIFLIFSSIFSELFVRVFLKFKQATTNSLLRIALLISLVLILFVWGIVAFFSLRISLFFLE